MKRKIGILLMAIMIVSILIACTPKDSGDSTSDLDIKDIHAKIKEDLGEDYLPDMGLSMEELEERTNINKDNIDKFIAEVPMISVHVDTFVAIKAMDGKGEEVENTLEEYRRYLSEEALNYPMNIAKVKAARVVRHGDYVFFIMAGKPNDIEDQESSEALEFSQKEVKRIEEIIDGFFK